MLLVVADDAPAETCLSLRLFTTVFMSMDASFKPGASAGGKGQARILLSSLDGLGMVGKSGFAAVVGVKYCACLDSNEPLEVSTSRPCSPLLSHWIQVELSNAFWTSCLCIADILIRHRRAA